MPEIKLLDKHTAELIAAGEVVERPASVIKELLENSIDAGATIVTVEIKDGGLTFIRITDNGCGISRKDVPTAFLRHATSKISCENDLDGISTLGFRGEALPSIASVARVELLTCNETEEIGTRYVIEGGEEILCDDAGCPQGTTIIVRDIFFNTPARLKFMRKNVTEAAQVSAVVDKLSISHPEISFRYIRDSKTVYQTPGGGDPFPAIRIVLGKEAADAMLPVDYDFGDLKVKGYISRPTASRANRNLQNFYINNRFVRTKTGIAALEQAYKNRIMTGKFPYCVLFVELPFSMVDVNVHPAKTEVRFTNEQPVFQLIYYAVKSALDEKDSLPSARISPALNEKKTVYASDGQLGISFEKKPTNNFENQSKASSAFVSATAGEWKNKNYLGANTPVSEILGFASSHSVYNKASNPVRKIDIDEAVDEEPQTEKLLSETISNGNSIECPEHEVSTHVKAIAEENEKALRVIGEVFKTYIVCSFGEDLYYIDKHAAHERMIFNTLKADSVTHMQMLLMPMSVSLSKEEYSVAIENLENINSCGFEIEDFGIGTLLVRSAPSYIEAGEIKEVVEEICGNLLDSKNTVTTEKLDSILHSVSCRAAVKGGDDSSEEELKLIAERVLRTGDILYCPHGRPVAVKVTRRQIEKMFGRLQ